MTDDPAVERNISHSDMDAIYEVLAAMSDIKLVPEMHEDILELKADMIILADGVAVNTAIVQEQVAIAVDSAISASNSNDEALLSATSASNSEGVATMKASEASVSATSASTSATTSTTQAGIAATKANEASVSASNALTSETNANDSEIMAHKWAQEAEDVEVAGTIGVDEEYSAYHWAKKAESAIGGNITLNSLYDVDTSGIVNGGMIRYNTDTSTWNSYDFTNNDVIGLDITANIAVGVGQIAWNATEGTADLGLAGGSTLQIGQENTRTVRNGTASTISDGTVCMFAGTVGNSGRIKVAPYTGIKGTHKYIYGVATQAITPDSDGLITIDGKVRGINTTGSLVGEVWNDEDILYVKPNDSGRLTNVEPVGDELKIVVATVIHAHTNGTLEVRVLPIDENMSYTKEQSDNTFVPLVGDFTLDLGGL